MTDARPAPAAPVVSRDDQALLADIFAKMEEVLKPLPGEECRHAPDAFPNMREASEYLETLSPERRAELEGEWE